MAQFTDNPDVADFERYLLLADTNAAAFKSMLDDCMADPLTIAINKAVTFVMNEDSHEYA